MGTIRTPIFPRAMEELYNGETCKTLHHSHYLVGVVWLVFGLFLSLSQPMDYVLCAVISIAAFV